MKCTIFIVFLAVLGGSQAYASNCSTRSELTSVISAVRDRYPNLEQLGVFIGPDTELSRYIPVDVSQISYTLASNMSGPDDRILFGGGHVGNNLGRLGLAACSPKISTPRCFAATALYLKRVRGLCR